LEFVILTAARSGEVRGATWDEIDLQARTWTIPAERMKSSRPHRVPLSAQAVTLLERVPRIGDETLVFPSAREGRPISDMTISAVLRRMGLGHFTVHGFRSSFRDWAAEQTNYPREICELALAHAVGEKVERAYQRSDLLEKRTRLMQDWAAHCERPAAGESVVVPIRKLA
jgi:integrase